MSLISLRTAVLSVVIATYKRDALLLRHDLGKRAARAAQDRVALGKRNRAQRRGCERFGIGRRSGEQRDGGGENPEAGAFFHAPACRSEAPKQGSRPW